MKASNHVFTRSYFKICIFLIWWHLVAFIRGYKAPAKLYIALPHTPYIDRVWLKNLIFKNFKQITLIFEKDKYRRKHSYLLSRLIHSTYFQTN